MTPKRPQHQPGSRQVGYSKKTYRKPVLKTYGLVRNLTQSVGTVNGDAGPGMMP